MGIGGLPPRRVQHTFLAVQNSGSQKASPYVAHTGYHQRITPCHGLSLAVWLILTCGTAVTLQAPSPPTSMVLIRESVQVGSAPPCLQRAPGLTPRYIPQSGPSLSLFLSLSWIQLLLGQQQTSVKTITSATLRWLPFWGVKL